MEAKQRTEPLDQMSSARLLRLTQLRCNLSARRNSQTDAHPLVSALDMSQRSTLRAFHQRMSDRMQSLFGSPQSEVSLALCKPRRLFADPCSVLQGYQAVPNNYGATSGAPNNGLQVLPADASKIEPKVSFGDVWSALRPSINPLMSISNPRSG